MINTEGLHAFLPFHEEIRALSRNIFTSGCAHACSELTLLYNYYYYYCIIVQYCIIINEQFNLSVTVKSITSRESFILSIYLKKQNYL